MLAPAGLVAPVFHDGDGGEGGDRLPPPLGRVPGGGEKEPPGPLFPFPLLQGGVGQDGDLQPLVLEQRVVAAAWVNHVWLWGKRFGGRVKPRRNLSPASWFALGS